MSLAISVENVSKVYHLGTINRGMLVQDAKRWMRHTFGGGRPSAELDAEDQRDDESLFWALRDVSFDIPVGETVGIIGANGAGKSTLLKIISRITAPSSGEVRINGRVGSLLEVGTGFHPEMTGRENIFMYGAVLGLSRLEVQAKLEEIVDFAGIEQFIDTPVKRYSSGMYIRLGFSVAAFLEPEILILDEVLAVGDMSFQPKCFDRLETLIKSGHTILFVAHSMSSVTRFCKEAIWLKKGTVHRRGKAEEVCEAFRSEQSEQSALAPQTPSPRQRREITGTGEFFPDYTPAATESHIVRSVRVKQSDKILSGSVESGSCLTIEIDFELIDGRPPTGRIESGSVLVMLLDEQGRQLVRIQSDCSGLQLPPTLGPTANVECIIPRLPFASGVFAGNVYLEINGQLAFRALSAFKFEVSPGDYYRTGIFPKRLGSPLLIDCKWSMKS